jgi:hypothetical protein
VPGFDPLPTPTMSRIVCLEGIAMSNVQPLLITVLGSLVFWMLALPYGRVRALLALPFCFAAIVLLVLNVPVPLDRELEAPFKVFAFASLSAALYFYYAAYAP